MYIFLLKDNLQEIETRYLKISFVTSIILIVIAILTRYLRMQKLEIFNNNITVGFEHIVAGFSIPSLISVTFLYIAIHIYNKYGNYAMKDAFFNSVLYRVIILLVAIYFTIDLSFIHETKQAFETVYGNKPRGYIQFWQIYCDQVGVFLYIVMILVFYSKHNKTLEINKLP